MAHAHVLHQPIRRGAERAAEGTEEMIIAHAGNGGEFAEAQRAIEILFDVAERIADPLAVPWRRLPSRGCGVRERAECGFDEGDHVLLEQIGPRRGGFDRCLHGCRSAGRRQHGCGATEAMRAGSGCGNL
ncbi:MAG: hypothetical protein ACREE5_14485 [Acetobacteraceae bacterium]